MNERALAVVFVLAIWWLSTGVVLRMVWLGRATFRYSVGLMSGLALVGLYGIVWSSHVTSPAAAYTAFGGALAVWGWHELLFLLGLVTGPRRLACPSDATGWRRFVYATAVVIHHELALAVTMLLLVALTWGAPNQVGASTFCVLWIMRLSAKLNVFLGVRNLTEQFVPEHLGYMLSYFRRARMNPLMPVSLVLACAMVVRLAGDSFEGPTAFDLVGRTLVATLLFLAVVEHVFLALPLPDALLWRWATRTKSEPSTDTVTKLGAEAQ
jgi:putative photosynthetic complex assembly protein 2